MRRSQFPFSAHDAVLRPVAKAHRDSPADVTVLALGCRALDAGIPERELRAWCISRCPGPVATLASDRRRFGSLVATARLRVTRVSSPGGRAAMRVAAARKIVACLLAPVPPGCPVSPRRVVRARAAFAVLGLEFLRRATNDGFDTIVVDAPSLAVELGVGDAAARAALQACVELGWLRRMPGRRGASARWKLPGRLTDGRDQIAWAHADLIDAIIKRADTDFTRALRAITHPAIAYGTDPVGHHAWLVGLATAAGVDPVTDLGMTAKTVGRFGARWQDATEREGLNPYAEITDALIGKETAEHARRERAETRRVEVDLDRFLKVTPIPDPDLPQEQRDVWLAGIRAATAGMGLAEPRKQDLALILGKRMTKQGYEPDRAERASRVIAGVAA